jgi:hypothetical protein
MRTIREELQTLPKSFEGNPQAELWSLCQSFTREVREFAGGKSENGDTERRSLLQEADSHYLEFQAEILRTRPNFRVRSAVAPIAVPIGFDKRQDQGMSLCILSN